MTKTSGSTDNPIGPGPRTGRSDLGETEERVRRLFRLEGLVPLDWEGGIVPVAIIGDTTLPGYGRQTLRRWIHPSTFSTTTGAGAQIGMEFTADVIIDRIASCRDVAPHSCHVYFQGPNDPDTTGPYTTRDAVYVERTLSLNEIGPTGRNAGETLPVATSKLIAGVSQALAGLLFPLGVVEHIVNPIMLLTGSRLHFGSTGETWWQIEGRLF